jgi:hypothetical protein
MAKSTGDVFIKTKEGMIFNVDTVSITVRTTFKAGRISGTLLELKSKVREILGIPEYQQHLFLCDETGKERELDEDWQTLTGNSVARGATLLLSTCESWHRTDTATATIHMTLPKVCASVLEHVLDYMSTYYNDPCTEIRLPEIHREGLVGMLWLAERLEMPRLQLQLSRRLTLSATADCRNLPALVARLGLSKVWDGAKLQGKSWQCQWLRTDRTEGSCDGLLARPWGQDAAIHFLLAQNDEGRLEVDCECAELLLEMQSLRLEQDAATNEVRQAHCSIIKAVAAYPAGKLPIMSVAQLVRIPYVVPQLCACSIAKSESIDVDFFTDRQSDGLEEGLNLK